MKACLPMLFVMIAPLVQSATPTTASQSALEAARELTGAVRDLDMSWMVDRMYPPLKRLYADQYSMRDKKSSVDNHKRITGIIKETDAQARARMDADARALRDSYVEIGRKMKQQGVKVESFVVSPAVSEYVVGLTGNVAQGVLSDSKGKLAADELKLGRDSSRLVVLPTTLVISVPDSRTGTRVRVEQKSFIYAVRDEIRETKISENRLNYWYFIDGKVKINDLRNFFTDIPLRLRLPITSSRQLN